MNNKRKKMALFLRTSRDKLFLMKNIFNKKYLFKLWFKEAIKIKILMNR
jgi:hypothetical protein